MPEHVEAKLVRRRGGLPNVIAKLQAGKDVTIAYFGGSITQADGWRPMTHKWFRKQFPTAKIKQVKAAIGGTGSAMGVFRVGDDVLKYNPDMVFVEFAVNDKGATIRNIWRAMEGIVRQIRRHNAETDICFIYTMNSKWMPRYYKKGFCSTTASAMEKLADHYNIPSIDVGLKIFEMVQADEMLYMRKDGVDPGERIVFGCDICHPTKEGHEVYTKVITDAIEDMIPAGKGKGKVTRYRMKKPFVEDNWEDAKMIPLTPDMLSDGWKKLPKNAKVIESVYTENPPRIWEATQPGEKISFKIRGSKVGLFDMVGPNGAQAICTVDGRNPAISERFDAYCSYHRLSSISIAERLSPNRIHTIEIEIGRTQPDRSCITDTLKDNPDFNPADFDGTSMWVASIMLIGEIVEDC